MSLAIRDNPGVLTVDGTTVISDTNVALDVMEGEPGLIALDLETSGLCPWRDQVAVVSLFGPRSNTAAVLHVRGLLPARLRAFLGDRRRAFVGFNSTMFDLLFLARAGCDVLAPVQLDAMIQEQVLRSTGRRDYRTSLQATLKRRLRREIDKELGTSSWMSDQLMAEQVRYCVDDVRHLPRLWEEQGGALSYRQRAALDLERRLSAILIPLVLRGVPIDTAALATYRQKQMQDTAAAVARLQAAWPGLNVNSSAQVRAVLTQVSGHDVRHATNETLQVMAMSGGRYAQLAEDILAAKRARKRADMYSDAWVAEHVTDGYLHAVYRQLDTDTGRVIATEPNAQQFPRDSRHCLAAPEGYRFVVADYTAIEVLTMAVLAHDQRMLRDLEHGDPHATIASQAFGVPLAEVTPTLRQQSKQLTFTVLFGGGAGLLARNISLSGTPCTVSQAATLLNRFFARYRGLHSMRERAYALAQERTAYEIQLPTGIGRVLAGPSLKGTTILNTSVQGTAAAGFKHALQACARAGLDKYLVALAHDEIVAVVPTGEAEDYGVALAEAMIGGMREVLGPQRVRTSVAIGPTWAKSTAGVTQYPPDDGAEPGQDMEGEHDDATDDFR
jgi:DNA polymerase I-like protein with 3'-5' exonuclease and polymerase domains